MELNAWRALGTGDVVGFLRSDLKSAKELVWVIGPWIDDFFGEFLVGSILSSIALRVVTRPSNGVESAFREHAVAARARFGERANTTVRVMESLHAKLVVIDEEIVYCGSANWYRYSLEESREIVLRGPAADASGLMDEVQIIWDQSVEEPLISHEVRNVAVSRGYSKEIIDPIAAAKLKEVEGSFIIKPLGRGRSGRA